jgi:predicted O-methyltransferase YrrM
MKTLPFVENSYAMLNEIVTAPIRSRLLMAGIDLGVFDEMDRFRSAEEIADAIGSHPGNTERMLNALATIGLVEKKEGRFRNGSEAQAFLVKQGPAYLGELMKMVRHMCLNPLDDLVERVRHGPPPAGENRDFASPAMWAEATRATAAWVTGGAGPQMARIISDLPEFSGFRRMLDLGGGHGMFTLYFVNAHPRMTGVVYDRSAVVAVADELIREYGMQDRVSAVAGDYLTGDIGTGYDLVWACATLNFARHDLATLFNKIRESLNPGGVFISFQDGMTHEQTQPDVMLDHLGDALRAERDLTFEQGQIAEAMLRCGFRAVRSRTIGTPMGEMDLDIARK